MFSKASMKKKTKCSWIELKRNFFEVKANWRNLKMVNSKIEIIFSPSVKPAKIDWIEENLKAVKAAEIFSSACFFYFRWTEG